MCRGPCFFVLPAGAPRAEAGWEAFLPDAAPGAEWFDASCPDATGPAQEIGRAHSPPRVHHVRFHGVFGPAARLRPSVTALAKPELPSVHQPEPEGGPTTNASSLRRASRLDWAALLKRVFEIEILRCARCGARMRVVAFITDRKASARILEHLGLPSHFPPLGIARAPPQLPLPD